MKIEVKVILGSAYFVSRSFYLVDLFFSKVVLGSQSFFKRSFWVVELVLARPF